LTINTPNIITVSVARKIIYGTEAIKSLPEVCDELGLKNIWIVTGGTSTKKIRDKTIIPILNSVNDLNISTIEIGKKSYTEEIDLLQNEFTSDFKEKTKPVNPYSTDAIFAAGGGRVMDIVKVVSNFTGIPWISVPTSASHDGFSSPFINFLLRRAIKKIESTAGKFEKSPPLAIIGDTNLIAKSPYKHLISGVGDLLAKLTAIKDWQLAARLRGDYYDEYAATFGLVSARIAEEGYSLIAQGTEPGVRLVTKALGNSGVAMSIAGNSRPASGCEHLISHYLDYLAENEKSFNTEKTTHGFQVGLGTVLGMYLHGGNWKKILKILESVKHPITFSEIGIDREILLDALLHAHTIRPERYTILGEGLTKKAALNAIDTTGVA
jgi:glycerol-1-phosphate dehydrogenase [NAD(P)+]